MTNSLLLKVVVLALSVGNAHARSAEDVLRRYLSGDFNAERMSRSGLTERNISDPTRCEYVALGEFDYDVDPFFVGSSFRVTSWVDVASDTKVAKITFQKLGEVVYRCGSQIAIENRQLLSASESVIVSITLKNRGTEGWRIVNPTKPFVGVEVLIELTTDQLERLERAQESAFHPRREISLAHIRRELEWLIALKQLQREREAVPEHSSPREAHQM